MRSVFGIILEMVLLSILIPIVILLMLIDYCLYAKRHCDFLDQ